MIGLDLVALRKELKDIKETLDYHHSRIIDLEKSYTNKCNQLNIILIILLIVAILGLSYNLIMGFIK